eukprot:6507340-Pyramimonas_sp.AAC.1
MDQSDARSASPAQSVRGIGALLYDEVTHKVEVSSPPPPVRTCTVDKMTALAQYPELHGFRRDIFGNFGEGHMHPPLA